MHVDVRMNVRLEGFAEPIELRSFLLSGMRDLGLLQQVTDPSKRTSRAGDTAADAPAGTAAGKAAGTDADDSAVGVAGLAGSAASGTSGSPP